MSFRASSPLARENRSDDRSIESRGCGALKGSESASRNIAERRRGYISGCIYGDYQKTLVKVHPIRNEFLPNCVTSNVLIGRLGDLAISLKIYPLGRSGRR